jgi:predicted nucleic acid-binding protein
MPLGKALQVLRFLRESPSLVFLSETARHWDIVDALLRESGVTGNVIFDAHIAALCIEHRVSEFLTGDADFRRFPGIKVVNPFK